MTVNGIRPFSVSGMSEHSPGCCTFFSRLMEASRDKMARERDRVMYRQLPNFRRLYAHMNPQALVHLPVMSVNEGFIWVYSRPPAAAMTRAEFKFAKLGSQGRLLY
ncbi:hypothetical protein PM082_021305 [Marasmius tenuissimus]|nr:hypothetical protein PM082_021305 [Marasmius tenuissimus]